MEQEKKAKIMIEHNTDGDLPRQFPIRVRVLLKDRAAYREVERVPYRSVLAARNVAAGIASGYRAEGYRTMIQDEV